MDIKEREGAEGPLPNLNGRPSVRDTDVVVKPLVRDNEGLIKEDLLRSEGAGCFGGSARESCMTSSTTGEVTSIGDISGVVSTWVVTMKGALWGSGDISIESFPGPGEEEGSGGVLARSRPLSVPNRFEEKSDRRGVGNCGL